MKKLTGPVLLAGTPSESADLRYASGFAPVDPVVYLRDGRCQYLVVPVMELGRAKREARRGVQVLTPLSLRLGKKDRRRLMSWALALLRRRNTQRVFVSPSFPVGAARRLERAGLRVLVAKSALFPQREVKSPDEVALIRGTQRATAEAMKAAVRTLRRARIGRDGFLRQGGRRLTAEDVRRVIDVTLASRQCVARETIVACGRVSADPHEQGSGPLRAGEPIVIDIFPQHRAHGYWGDMTRTVIRGKAPPELRKMYAAVRAAQAAALSLVKPGMSLKRIHRAVEAVFAKRGFRTEMRSGKAEGFIHSTGHGVGLDIHEMPSVSPGGGRVKAGHVITIEPGLYYSKIGGVRIEDTVVVTRKGWAHLARCAKSFEV